MAGPTTIGQLWTPSIWIPAMRERQATFPALFNSGTVARADLFDQLASGPGYAVNAPFLRDITDTTDELQVENTAPVANNAITGSYQVMPILNRVTKYSSTALAKQLSGADPMSAIIDQMLETRLKQRQTTLIAALRGLFASAGAANPAAAALKGALYVDPQTGNEIFTENGNAVDANLMSADVFIAAKALMGELADSLKDGCFLVHPNVKARLEVLDSLNFKTLIKASELPFSITTYRDIPIFTSTALVRAQTGGNGGYVYDSYLITKGTVGYGEKPQQGDTTDVASLQYWRDRDLNNELIWDRTRFMLGIAGVNWTGVPANINNGPTNAEFQTAGNWALAFQTANRVGAVCIRTNG
jgi:hypothetical protein